MTKSHRTPIDSGITGAHQDLDYAYINDGWDYGTGANYTDVDATPGALTAENFYDNNGHGTAVTGILQAKTDNGIGIAGLLSEAEIIPLRVDPAKKSSKEAALTASSRQVAQAIRDAVDRFGEKGLNAQNQGYKISGT